MPSARVPRSFFGNVLTISSALPIAAPRRGVAFSKGKFVKRSSIIAAATFVVVAGLFGGAGAAVAAPGDPYIDVSNITASDGDVLSTTIEFDQAPNATTYPGAVVNIRVDGGESFVGQSPGTFTGHYSVTVPLSPGPHQVAVRVPYDCGVDCLAEYETLIDIVVADVTPEVVYIEAESPARLGLADGSSEADYNTVVIPSAECVAYNSGGSTVSGNVTAPSGGTASSTCENTVVTGGSWDLAYEAFSRSSTTTQRHDTKCESKTTMEDTVLQQETRYVQDGQLTEWFAERPQITDTQEVAATPEELKAAGCDNGPGPDPDPSTDPDPEPEPSTDSGAGTGGGTDTTGGGTDNTGSSTTGGSQEVQQQPGERRAGATDFVGGTSVVTQWQPYGTWALPGAFVVLAIVAAIVGIRMWRSSRSAEALLR